MDMQPIRKHIFEGWTLFQICQSSHSKVLLIVFNYELYLGIILAQVAIAHNDPLPHTGGHSLITKELVLFLRNIITIK